MVRGQWSGVRFEGMFYVYEITINVVCVCVCVCWLIDFVADQQPLHGHNGWIWYRVVSNRSGLTAERYRTVGGLQGNAVAAGGIPSTHSHRWLLIHSMKDERRCCEGGFFL